MTIHRLLHISGEITTFDDQTAVITRGDGRTTIPFFFNSAANPSVDCVQDGSVWPTPESWAIVEELSDGSFRFRYEPTLTLPFGTSVSLSKFAGKEGVLTETNRYTYYSIANDLSVSTVFTSYASRGLPETTAFNGQYHSSGHAGSPYNFISIKNEDGTMTPLDIGSPALAGAPTYSMIFDDPLGDVVVVFAGPISGGRGGKVVFCSGTDTSSALIRSHSANIGSTPIVIPSPSRTKFAAIGSTGAGVWSRSGTSLTVDRYDTDPLLPTTVRSVLSNPRITKELGNGYWFVSSVITSAIIRFLDDGTISFVEDSVGPPNTFPLLPPANPKGFSTFYDGAVAGFLTDSVTFVNLRLMLLAPSVVFNPSHTTIAQVTNNGVDEVWGGGWPQGGPTLTDVNISDVNGTVALRANPVAGNITSGTITAVKAVVYDAFTDRPLVFVELPIPVTAETGDALQFNWNTEFGIVAFT